jgi:hypothetical protein
LQIVAGVTRETTRYRLSESIKSACPLRKNEVVLGAYIIDVMSFDPDDQRDHFNGILVLTEERMMVIETRRNVIFYPNHQVGSLNRIIDHDRIESMEERELGRGSIIDIRVMEEDPLVILEVREVNRFEGLKIMTGGTIPFDEMLDNLQSHVRRISE